VKFGLIRSWKAWLSALGLICLALAYFGYRYRGHVFSAFGWISEETGGKTMAVLTIALTLCALIYALFCLLFPIIVCFGLRDLRRRTAEIEQTTQKILQASRPRGE
jgi:hypothetical protein